MFYFCPMRIPSALRRKQDEIVATIARYEARIEAARMDLAVLNQVARLFDPEIGRGVREDPRARRYPFSGMRSLGVGATARRGANWRFPQPTSREGKYGRNFLLELAVTH
jgi:hypothetical protein